MNRSRRAYVIVEVTIKDERMYQGYVRRVRPIIRAYQGECSVMDAIGVHDEAIRSLEHVVTISFESKYQLERCFGSEEYQEIAPLLELSARTRFSVCDGESEQRVLYACA
jgi:uncharacterized protein (DUF1330 family)